MKNFKSWMEAYIWHQWNMFMRFGIPDRHWEPIQMYVDRWLEIVQPQPKMFWIPAEPLFKHAKMFYNAGRKVYGGHAAISNEESRHVSIRKKKKKAARSL